ncbi:hypothetical protein BBO_07328 [Beauveria brongniartii RCEF 3172]|uniref:Uncharacterized protein n=1 Tax=Beauveria brongniartii RCEF 3172 TaxID=1081107 RepID=A0A166ZIB4_9HYPO|nr:hypothetical protein BBO_07328 [Beauveria brongniartii RCEF 3172]
MPPSTQKRHLPSLRSAAIYLFCSLAFASAAPRRHPPPGGPFRAQQSVPTDMALSRVITGLYANDTAPAQIVVHDVNGRPSWIWSAADAAAQPDMPADLLRCIQSPTALPEAKWANFGQSVLSIYNAAALLINHAPGGGQDKRVTFGVCLNRDGMTNTHSLELVPDGQLAVATTNPSAAAASIVVFNVSAGLQANAAPAQSLNGLPAAHGLVWDEAARLLWGVGSSADPSGALPAAPALAGYRYGRGAFQSTSPTYAYNVTGSDGGVKLGTEWNGTQYAEWWDGGHDVTGVPGRRELLFSTDTDLHVFDIDSQTFESGAAVARKYLPGFMPVDSRVGADGQALPRSDIKSLSIDGNHNVLYVQAAWQGVTSNQINLLENGRLRPGLTYSQALYRARWFADTPTWPKARLQPSS